jgi:hypothetical protein
LYTTAVTDKPLGYTNNVHVCTYVQLERLEALDVDGAMTSSSLGNRRQRQQLLLVVLPCVIITAVVVVGVTALP